MLAALAVTAVCACSGLDDQTASLEGEARARRVDHVVVVMMENRSFDHMLGWVPGADGQQAGLAYPDETGALHSTHRLSPDFQGCAHPDPDHTYEGGRVEYNGGACDGWLLAGDNDDYAIGYYTAADLPFYASAMPRFVTLDRYFSAIMASTFPNRIYQHAAQTDRLDNTLAISTLPTIWDRLADAGVEGRYYYSDMPFLALWGVKYQPISRPIEAFVEDAVNGDLPAVSFVDPRFLGEEEGVSGDDHPHADIRNGQAFLDTIYRAVTHSPDWKNTVLVINYDEWGGFFDHVPPPAAPIPASDAALGSDGRLGFRAPAIVIAPWAAAGTVSSVDFDHTSVLRMIENRWNLAPLTVRDATANDLADALDFTQRSQTPAPGFSVPDGPFGAACDPVPLPDGEIELTDIAGLAALLGWPIFDGTQADLAALLDELLELRP
jgi:phospholipase C